MVPNRLNAAEILDREFLAMRARLLEVAASLDRIARADGSVEDDPRMKQVRAALDLMADGNGDYAERFQMAFSLPYNGNWRQQYGISVS